MFCAINPARLNSPFQEASGINKVIAEHKADTNYAIVSAASIIAKVSRDSSIRALERSLGATIGSGYPSDARTIAFLKKWLDARGDLPPGTRRSWKTAQNLLSFTPEKHESGSS